MLVVLAFPRALGIVDWGRTSENETQGGPMQQSGNRNARKRLFVGGAVALAVLVALPVATASAHEGRWGKKQWRDNGNHHRHGGHDKGTTTTVAPTTTVKPTTTTAKPATTLPPATVKPTTTTTAKPATTLPPSTVAPGPVLSSYPSAANTGAPNGTAFKTSGAMTITTGGTVIDGYDINGVLEINASNVTIKNSRIRNSGYWVIRVSENASNVTVMNSTIDGMGTGENSMGILGNITLAQGNNIFGVENGITPNSNATIVDNYIHDLKAAGAPHYDGIQIDGGQKNVVIRHNTIDLGSLQQTAAVMIDNYFGPIDGIVVDNNKLNGGGYILYVDGSFNSQLVQNVSITNNRFGKGFWGNSVIRGALKNVTNTGNVADATGAAVSL